jgi:hypothetical protein
LLHPPLLDEAGLNSASRWFVEGFGKRSGIDVNLDVHDGAGRLPEATELVLFRVLQESLTNVHRHSGAKRADVSLQTAGNHVILRVRDYGNGMPPKVLRSLRPPLEERGAAYVVPVPRNGKIITSTLLTNSEPTFQNSSEGAVWGYSHSVFTTGDGIPIGGKIEFFVGARKEYEAEQGKKKHSEGILTPAESTASGE